MSINKKLITAVAAVVVIVGAIVFISLETAGGTFDVIANKSVQSFGKVLAAMPDKVSQGSEEGSWVLTAPDDSTRFHLGSGSDENARYDVMLQTDLSPFILAGLDTSKLPDHYDVSDDLLTVGVKLEKKLAGSADESALSVYKRLVDNDRSMVNYHTEMDHFGVKLGDGNMFEWAKNLEMNASMGENQDKDIVFVLNPEPLIEAGVDPEKVEGWMYLSVPVMENGKKMEVYKLLKPFNIQ